VPIYFAGVSTVAVLAGLALYFRQAGGFQLWTTTPGLVFTAGAIAARLTTFRKRRSVSRSVTSW